MSSADIAKMIYVQFKKSLGRNYWLEPGAGGGGGRLLEHQHKFQPNVAQ